MASLNRERRGGREIGWRIRWVEADGRQVTLRLGDITRRNAERMLLLVERLLEARRLGTPLDSETAKWVKELSPEMAQRLAKVGLIEPRRAYHLRRVFEGLSGPAARCCYWHGEALEKGDWPIGSVLWRGSGASFDHPWGGAGLGLLA
jgi:hypothetical protein